jgi:hypothetical protein
MRPDARAAIGLPPARATDFLIFSLRLKDSLPISVSALKHMVLSRLYFLRLLQKKQIFFTMWHAMNPQVSDQPLRPCYGPPPLFSTPRSTRDDYFNCVILDSHQTYEKKSDILRQHFFLVHWAPYTKMYINCLSHIDRSVVVCLSILRCASKGKYRDSRLLRSRRPPATHLLSFAGVPPIPSVVPTLTLRSLAPPRPAPFLASVHTFLHPDHRICVDAGEW